MSIRSVRIVVAALLISAVPAAAQQPPLPGALVCSFKTVAAGTLDQAGGYEAGKPSTMDFTIAAIDSRAKTAQMVGNVGTSRLWVVLGTGSVNFVEPTPAGNLMLTTVILQGDGPFGAIHSRHTVMSDHAVVTQYVGTCEPRS